MHDDTLDSDTLSSEAIGNNSQSSDEIKALAELVEALHREDIDFTDDMEVRTENSRDASIFTQTPQIVIYPRNSSEIGTIVRELKHPLFLGARAGGTCMTGAPLTKSVLLNLTKHMTYIEVRPEHQEAIVEMGALYRDIELKTMEHSLYMASYPSSKDVCGIGGMIGNNASGEKSLRYGATIDNVLAIKAVLSDGIEYNFEEMNEIDFIAKTELDTLEGDIYKMVRDSLNEHEKAVASLQKDHPVKKCASGYRIDRVVRINPETKLRTYNLTPLFVGSQATLGIITEAKIKLTKKQEFRKLIFMGVKTLSDLPQILKTILSHDPESVETFDIHTFERSKGFNPMETNRIEKLMCVISDEKIADVNIKKSTKTISDLGFSLFVIAEFASDTHNIVEEQAKDTVEELSSVHDLKVYSIDDTETYSSIWKIRRSSFGVMRDYKDGTKHAVPCIEDVIVPVSKFDIFIPRLTAILDEQGIFFGFHGHIGEGSLRIIPFFDLADPNVVDKIDTLCKSVFALIKELGGNMSADHSDGIVRTPYLRKFYGDEIYNIFVTIKNTFDPENIFNPGKKIGGTVEDIKKDMIQV